MRASAIRWILGLAAALALGAPAVADSEEGLARWVRLLETDDRVLRLEIASRQYEPRDGNGPTITLSGAVHIGERPYYRKLQRVLDEQDVVLYEGVNPSGSGELGPDLTDDERRAWTKTRLRLAALLLERAFQRDGRYPASLDELAGSFEHERHAAWLEAARVDGWGGDTTYLTDENGTSFDLVSRGADGEPGGEDGDADLRWSDQPPLTDAETGASPGLQARMARAFRLRFQLDEMDESGDGWRNSDLSIDDVERLLEERGVTDIALFDLLDGSSAMASVAGWILNLVEALPGASARGRLMVMEMLGSADPALLSGGLAGGEALMEVLIDERNQRVLDDLAKVLDEQGHGSIGVVYGAAHMPDMEARLADQLGYEPSAVEWLPAMRLPLDRVGITPYERTLFRVQLHRQLQQMREQAGDGG